MKNTYKILLIITLIALAYQIFFYKPTPEIIEREVIVSDTVIDTVRVSLESVPKYIYKDTGKIEFIKVDSLAILKDYLTKYYYSDTILNDTTGFIFINDTIYQNSIKSRQIELKVYPRTIFEHKTTFIKEPPKNKIFLGGSVSKFGFSLGGVFVTKKENIFGISYDPINKTTSLSCYFKIKIKSD